MALLWADNFSAYGIGGQAKMLDGAYAATVGSGTSLVTDPAGGGLAVVRLTQSAAQVGGYPSYGTYLRKAFAAAETTLGGFVRIYMPFLPIYSTTSPYILFADAGNAAQITIRMATTGAIEVLRGDERSGTLIGTSTVCLTAGAWHHIEWKILASQTVGTVEIRVNGEVVLALTGQDTCATANVSYDQMALGCNDASSAGDAADVYWKDLVLWDTSGSQNNDFMGTCFVQRCIPTGDVSFNWTASTGATGYNLIDDTGPNDADYISATVAQTTPSEFDITDLPSDATSVRGMLIFGRMKASDGGDCKVQMGVKSNAVAGLGTDRQITAAWTYWWDIRELNPDTSAPFTPAEFNAMTVTIDRTT